MLVLSRKKDEVIRIGNDIHIMVVGVQGGQVRLGVSAPQAIPVHRAEIYHKIQEAKEKEA